MSAEEAGRIARAAERVRRSGGLAKIGLPTAAALGAGAAIAIGSIGGGGTITGCFVTGPSAAQLGQGITLPADAYGQLRVIDPSAPTLTIQQPTGGIYTLDNNKCETQEQTITWNQQGPQGPQGPTGAQGPQGDQGSAGGGGVDFNIGAGSKIFLKLDGVKGESTDHKHKDWIEVSSFSWGVSNRGASGGGGGAGKTTIQSFSITKRLDKSSPNLLLDETQGKMIKSGELDFVKGGKSYLKIDFNSILIGLLKTSSGGGGGAGVTENVSLNFAKMQFTYTGAGGQQKAIPVSLKLNTQ